MLRSYAVYFHILETIVEFRNERKKEKTILAAVFDRTEDAREFISQKKKELNFAMEIKEI